MTLVFAGRHEAARKDRLSEMSTRILLAMFSAFIFLLVLLPSGSLWNVNIKAVFSVILFLLVLGHALNNGINKQIFNATLFLIAASTFLLLWLFIGLLKFEGSEFYGLTQMKDFVATISATWVGYYLYRSNVFKWQFFFLLVLWSHVTYIFVKLIFFCLIVTNVISLGAFVDAVRDIFHVTIVSLDLLAVFEGLSFIRLDLLNDSLSPFLLLFLLNVDLFKVKITPKVRYLIYLLLFLNLVISFKRSLIMAALIAIAYSVVVLMKSNARLTTVITLTVATLLLYSIYPVELNYLFTERFLSASQEASDITRSEQIGILINEFSENPLFGKGLGGYSKLQIRAVDLPYTYEVQWLAFLMQFGIIGLIIVFLIYSLTIAPILKSGLIVDFKVKSIILLAFVLWGLMSFTNPMMTASFCSVFYTLLLLSSLELATNRPFGGTKSEITVS